jgi:HEPN domain-containing protein
MNALTAEWVAKADDDFHAAELLQSAKEFSLPGICCFHCQQCAEKYLKAYLQEQAVRFERTHDLIALLSLCLKVDIGFKNLQKDLDQLENYSVAVRYPGMNVSSEIAQEALLATQRVRQFVRVRLEIE